MSGSFHLSSVLTGTILGAASYLTAASRTLWACLVLYTAFEQSCRDAGNDIPAVFHRRNHKPWLVIMSLEDWLDMYDAVDEPARASND